MPTLILVSGAPGAGKSTFAIPLAQQLKAAYLEIDSLGDPFTLERDAAYKTKVEPFIIQGLLNLARCNLQLGNDVILDLPWTLFFKELSGLKDQILKMVLETSATLQVFECVVTETELFARITNRGAQRDAPKIKDGYKGAGWNEFTAAISFGATQPLPHTVIDATKPQAENVALALGVIRGDVAMEARDASLQYA